MAEFVVELASFDQKRLWLDLGYASLFDFLHRELGLSKGAAHYRKVAAELVQKFPEVVEALREGKLCITSIVHLAKVLTPENRAEMLPRFFHLSRREAMEVAAAAHPAEAAPRREVVTALRTPALVSAVEVKQPASPAPDREPGSAAELDPSGGEHRSLIPLGGETEALPQAEIAPPLPKRDSADPLTAELSRFHFTVSRRFLAKLDAARDALSHSHPGASAEEILEAGLDLVLARQAKRRGLVERPRRPVDAPRPKSDRVPAHVSRAVWNRDKGRCQWPLQGGGTCGSTYMVEIDHIEPKARGGPSTVENTRLACRVHNQYAARRVFGDEWMDRFTCKGGD